ncbi:reverse transcriptase [Labeo rohita]|uniref:Reverse transcriptase n=1 Tax=Labeo rohita TaxID=84645 RepID=A0A498M1K1_LABRO|nr:reverse transcriptase [Labeo rohita]
MDSTDWYGRASGAKHNRSKSEAQLFGSWDGVDTGRLDDRESLSPIPGLTVREAKQVWKNTSHPTLQNRHKDLSWMVAHEILLVKAVMHWHGQKPDLPTARMQLPRDFRHLLWECRAARDLWAKTGPLYFPCLPAGGAQIGYQLAILGVGRGLKDMTAQEFTWLTLNVIVVKVDWLLGSVQKLGNCGPRSDTNDSWINEYELPVSTMASQGWLHKVTVKDREPVSPITGFTLCEAKQVWKNASHPALQNCPRPRCNFLKTVQHLLWECSAARDLWAKTGPLYFPCLPAILGMGRGLKDLTAQEFTSLWLTLSVIKDAIWATRNLLAGKRVTVPLHACELQVTSMLQGYRAMIFGQGGWGRTERVPATTDLGRL